MKNSPGRLYGKAALVTGGASGIGRAIATAFVDEGAEVGIVDRSPLDVGVAKRVRLAVQADVTNETEISSAISSFAESAGGLDVLVHCAAVQLVGADSVVGSLEAETWTRTVDVNLTGTFFVCRAAVRAMLAAGRGGSIIVCGSPTGLRGMSPDFTAYSSSKGGVHSLTRVIASAYGTAGIRANTLIPGATETALTAELFEDQSLRARLIGRTPLGRLGSPEDYVGAAVFLASGESAFATGAEFVIDGGYSAS